MTRRAAIGLLALLAAGCGQTDELFLPGEPRPALPAEPAPAQTPGEQDAGTEEDDEETPAR